jgi:stage II sporulation protein D
MSQYGAYGFARHGRGYRWILDHYYRRTKVRKADGRPIRVLLASGVGAVRFTRAGLACGRNLKRDNTYRFLRQGSDVLLRRKGNTLKNCGRNASTRGGIVKAFGHGVYRGRLIAKARGGGLALVNQVGMEAYVSGVVPNEVPASWPRAAVRAQAVAARSYALATRKGGFFDHYDDTRSQVYGGRGSETRATNRAVARTHHEVVKHSGRVAVTYFFSTSGGQTENVEFAFVGSSPSPYLKSVDDPYDRASPVHRWRVRLSDSRMESRLAGLFSGNLRKINVLKRGRSPRIVRARIVGSNGSSKITGPALQSRLGTRSTWMRFVER